MFYEATHGVLLVDEVKGLIKVVALDESINDDDLLEIAKSEEQAQEIAEWICEEGYTLIK